MITEKGYNREFNLSLTCFHCRKQFSSAWHLDKHLEAGKCKPYTEKHYDGERTRKQQQVTKIQRVRKKQELCTCSKCGKQFLPSEFFSHKCQ